MFVVIEKLTPNILLAHRKSVPGRKSQNLFLDKISPTLLYEGFDVGCEIVGFKLGLSDGVRVGVDVGAEKKYKKITIETTEIF